METDYRLSPFMFALLMTHRTLYPDLKEQLRELRKHLVESTNEMAPLKVWQMQGELLEILQLVQDTNTVIYTNTVICEKRSQVFTM